MKLSMKTILIFAVLSLLIGCQGEGGFSALEEENAALVDQSGFPILSKIKDQVIFASSVFLVDVNNESSGDDAGMTYQCAARQIDSATTSPTVSCDKLLPLGNATFDQKIGVFQWEPTNEQIGTYSISLVGSNNSGVGRETFRLEVVDDTRPELTKVSDQLAERGKSLTVDFDNIKTGDDKDMVYACYFDKILDREVLREQPCADLPGGPIIKFDSNSGVLAWLPEELSNDRFEILVVGENKSAEDQVIFAITVVEPRGETIRLTSVRDILINEAMTVIVDVDNVVTDDDVDVTYNCFYDVVLDGAVTETSSCIGLPGEIAGTFNTKKGIFAWQPNLATAVNVEIMITGVKSGVADQEIFVVLFDQEPSGQIGNSALSFDPPSLNFGNIQVGQESANKTVTVTNDSSQQLHLEPPAIGNSNFSVVLSTCPVSPAVFEAGASCIVGLKFVPSIAAQLGTTVLFRFGQSTAATNTFEASYGLSGNGVGFLSFDGLDSITNITHNSMKLNWTANSDAISYIIFKVLPGGALQFIESVVNSGPAVNSKNYVGLAPSTAYKYRVRATDVFGVTDGNVKDVEETTLANRPPQLPAQANPVLRGGQLVANIDFNDAVTGSDLDEDGDIISYKCSYDAVIDGSVAGGAALCNTISNEDGSFPSFNVFTGILSNWRPRHADVGTDFEVRIDATDAYAATTNIYISGTVQPGQPLLADITERIFPNDFITPGDAVSENLGNIRFGAPSDDGMTYSCSFQRLEIDGPGVIQACTLLPGGATFNTTSGAFDWTPDGTGIGSYLMTFTGTNGGGSHSLTLVFAVVVPYTNTNALVDYQAGYADLKKSGVNGAGFDTSIKDLSGNGVDGTLTNFLTTAWDGLGTLLSPYSLVFDGIDDFIDLGTSLNANDDVLFEAWLFPTTEENNDEVILSNGDAANRGYTLTNRALFSGSGSTNYAAEVLADSPAAYYRFNETSGISVADSSGNGIDGVLTNASNIVLGEPSSIKELADKSLKTGLNGVVSIPAVDLAGDWAIETWFEFPFPANCPSWCAMTFSTSNEYAIMVNNARLLGSYSGGFIASGYDMDVLTPGWHHLVASQESGVVTFYVNGVNVGNHSTPMVQNIAKIGNHSTASYPFGKIDEVAIYTSSLNVTRVQAHYDSGNSISRCDFSLLPNYWQHLSGIVNKSADELKIFIDKNEACSTSLPPALPIAGSTESMKIGKDYNGVGQKWTGKLAEVRWHDTVSPAIISTNFDAKSDKFSPRSPIPTNGLKTWIIAGTDSFQDDAGTVPAIADNDPVALAKDLSSANIGLAQTNATFRPLLKTNVLNGKPVFEFDGVNDRLQNTIDYGTPSTMFYVGRILAAPRLRLFGGTLNNWLLGFYNGSTDRFYANGWIYNAGPAVVDGEWILYSADIRADFFGRIFRNGAFAGGNTGGTQGLNGLSIGGSSNQWSDSQVAAVIIYDRVLTSAERQAVEAYLNDLYGVY